jgi:hypothetical protein
MVFSYKSQQLYYVLFVTITREASPYIAKLQQATSNPWKILHNTACSNGERRGQSNYYICTLLCYTNPALLVKIKLLD